MIVNYLEIMEAYRRWNADEAVTWSTGICGSATAGYGTLDEYGYWEFPLHIDQGTLTIVDIL
jgi:hypothetical protein